MRLTSDGLDAYVADLAELAERYGITLDLPEDGTLAVEIERDGSRRFQLVGFLPDGRQPPKAVADVRERWRPGSDDLLERSGYRYELIDHERDHRRAFHRHDDRAFERRFGVVVHEHCESPIGDAPCPHMFGPPVRDGCQAIVTLMSTWVGDPPDCRTLRCLESM